EGLNHKVARERIETLISNIIDEYLSAIKNAPWRSKEDRFGYTREIILTKYIRKLSYAVSFANRYSIPDQAKDTIAEKYRTLFLEQYRLLYDSQLGLLIMFSF
ncbi:hypothetical protein PENTCL1PPCAC_7493, partial [Pristionchus entomophagus]